MQVNIAKRKLEEMLLISPNRLMLLKNRGNHPPSNPKLITNPPKTFNIVWPAIIFANNLTDKLTGLLKYEIISIMVINGNSTADPLETNILSI